jgi:tetratricopeptide (TPR) repeat protein
MDPELMRNMMQMFAPGTDVDAFIKNAGDAMQADPPPVYSVLLRSPWTRRQLFLHGYNHYKSQAKEPPARTNRDKVSMNVRHTIVPSIEHGEAPPMEGLKRTSLQDVARMVNHIHNDKVLFVKTIHEPYTVVGRTLLVEDDAGDCLSLSLYNCQHDLPVGTYLALIAPFMKTAQDKPEGMLMLRCDNPQCVMLFDTPAEWRAVRDGKQPPSEDLDPIELKKLGNQAFEQNKYEAADRYYSRALRVATIDDRVLRVACLSNRSEVALREERWEDAERDAAKALSVDKDNVKAKYRLAKALIRLGKSGKALELGKELITASPSDKVFQEVCADAERALEEQAGKFDFHKMRKELSSSRSTAFHADFVSQAIEIGADISLSSGGTYRGCRALRDIPANELLTASKAFAYAIDSGDDVTFQVDVKAKHMSKGSQIQLVADVVAKIWKRPMLAGPDVLYKLSAGVDIDRQKMENSGNIDIPRIRRILSSNVFGSNGESEDAQRHWARILNPSAAAKDGTGSCDSSGSGLWLKESMFNHSCAPNCTWCQIGDHIFFRSARPIQQGEELCVAYTAHENCYEARTELFASWISSRDGFECQCAVCSALRSDQKLGKMEKKVHAAYAQAVKLVLAKRMTNAHATESLMPSIERQRLLSELEDYPLHLQHNTGAKLHVMHGICLDAKGEKHAALEHFQKAADIGYAVRGGAQNMDRAMDLWRVVGSSLRCEQKARAKELLDSIWKSSVFAGFSSPAEAQAAFVDLTLHYSMSWWIDEQDHHRERFLRNLAMETAYNPKPRRANKKKSRNKKN